MKPIRLDNQFFSRTHDFADVVLANLLNGTLLSLPFIIVLYYRFQYIYSIHYNVVGASDFIISLWLIFFF